MLVSQLVLNHNFLLSWEVTHRSSMIKPHLLFPGLGTKNELSDPLGDACTFPEKTFFLKILKPLSHHCFLEPNSMNWLLCLGFCIGK